MGQLPISLLTRLAVGLACLLAGTLLAWQHPLWPAVALSSLLVWAALAARYPLAWLFTVPALLPVLNFSPWTGWLIFNEFDLLLLGALAGGYLRLGLPSSQVPIAPRAAMSRGQRILFALLAGSVLTGLGVGLADAWAWAPGRGGSSDYLLFQGYSDALNSLRVAKSLAFGLMFLPLLGQALATAASGATATLLFGRGVLAGLALVSLAVFWERMAFPGLMDFSSTYRTTALFWEMHVGGAAIDAYLAITVPFVVWGLSSAKRFGAWLPVALLALLAGYACLTTFARGVYLAVGLPLLALAIRYGLQRAHVNVQAVLQPLVQRMLKRLWPGGWRGRSALVLLGLLAIEIAGVMGGGTFMQERLARSGSDLDRRVEHWGHGLSLLHTPGEWLLGIGLGRLPASYAREVPDGGFSGRVTWGRDGEAPAGRRYVSIAGPAGDPDLGGLFGLTQRVSLIPGAAYRVAMDVRSLDDAIVYLRICERHLIYDGDCQGAALRVRPSDAGWQRVVIPLRGDVMTGGTPLAPRFGVFSVSVVTPDVATEFSNIRLIGPQNRDVLNNGDFAQGLARWFPVAQTYFLPWHIDNLFLELLIERGLAGLLLFLALVAQAFRRLIAASAQGLQIAPYLAASIIGALLVGLTGSLMDVPRIAFLLFLVTFFSIRANAGPLQASHGARV